MSTIAVAREFGVNVSTVKRCKSGAQLPHTGLRDLAYQTLKGASERSGELSSK